MSGGKESRPAGLKEPAEAAASDLTVVGAGPRRCIVFGNFIYQLY